MPLKINLEEKKISRVHPLIHHQPFMYSFSRQPKFFHDPEFCHHFSLISSGAAFTSNSQEIQGRLSTDTGIILDLAYKYILHISNNHPLACWPRIIWIIWPAKYCNSSFFIAAPCSYWLQFRWDTSETSKYLLSRPISPHVLSPSATLTLTLLSGTRIPRQQSIFFRDWSHLPGRRRGSSIGLIGRIIWWSQGQTSGNTPISASRHWPTSQKC